ncbi:hypothetical protein LXA43DRAFT_747388 [Ganoderma leucocontextum]|nr:hypothetical protein LXA43DRAFT_747388 [Ganoderma leucocontextum]
MTDSYGVERSIAHINQLPNELLVQLFLHYAEGAIPESKRHASRTTNMRWLPLMLVCRYWRDVALASPSLWRVVRAAFKTSWTTLVLARSATATIDFTFGVRGFSPVKTFKALSPHVSRLQSLRFIRIQDAWRPAALKFLCGAGDFPNLETLEFPVVSLVPGLEDTVANFTDIHISSQRFPCLRSLHLRLMIAPQDLSLCAKLQRLSLEWCLWGSSFDAFLDVLTSYTLLQTFTLVASLQYLPGDWVKSSTPRRPPIRLPSLTELSLREHPPAYTSGLLLHLFLPPTVSVVVSSVLVDESNTVHGIPDMLPPLHADGIPALASTTDVTVIQAVGHKYSFQSVDNRAPTHPGVCLSIEGDIYTPVLTLSRALGDLTRVFGSAPLRHLTIIGDCSDVEPDTWSSMFLSFPLLESLRVVMSPNFINPVQELFLGLRNAVSGARPACPKLDVIEMEGWAVDDEFVDALVDCLQCRSERGLALLKLEIHLTGFEGSLSEVVHALGMRLQGLVSEYSMRGTVVD